MKYILYSLLILVMISCGQDEVSIVPKPRMYPRVDYPERGYQAFDKSYCDFTFDMPRYATIRQDTSYSDDREGNECWFDLRMQPLNAELNFSYIPVSPANPIDKLVGDAFTLVGKHNTKAEYIEETMIHNQYGNGGMKFSLDGEVASPIQFFVTDTTHHFVRASLYFNSKVNSDSIAPILEFVEADIDTLLATFQWIDQE